MTVLPKVVETDDIIGNHAAAVEHCEECGARLPRNAIEGLPDSFLHTAADCIARQRLDIMRHIRDELRRVNLYLDALAVAAKVSNDKSDELRKFYGKVIDTRRRDAKARLGAVVSVAERLRPTAADLKRTARNASKIVADIDRAKKKRAKVRRR